MQGVYVRGWGSFNTFKIRHLLAATMADIIIRTIIEMLGKPKEHIEKTLHDYVEKLSDGNITIIDPLIKTVLSGEISF